jgi:hypothetical protein
LPDHVADEFAHSHDYGGRSVFGWEPAAGENEIGPRSAGSAMRDAAANLEIRTDMCDTSK